MISSKDESIRTSNNNSKSVKFGAVGRFQPALKYNQMVNMKRLPPYESMVGKMVDLDHEMKILDSDIHTKHNKRSPSVQANRRQYLKRIATPQNQSALLDSSKL